MGILETYRVKWSLEKTARDILQNFFDHERTLENVNFDLTKDAGRYRVRISNSAEYDHRMLLHIGATDKTSGMCAGGFGEGAKIAALILLRDYGFERVTYASSDWQVRFSLCPLPEDDYPKPVRGLFAEITNTGKKINGNYIELIASSKENAEAILGARNLFYSPDNPDFSNPVLDVPGTGRFKLLSTEKDQRSGNLYIAGQRTNYYEDKWQTVEDVNLWVARSDLLPKDRDRGKISFSEMDSLIDHLVQNSPNDKLEAALFAMKPIWDKPMYSTQVGYKIMEKTVHRMAESGMKYAFENQYLADNLPYSAMLIKENLKSSGYKVVPPFFKQLGMKGAMEKYKELQSHFRIEASRLEARRIGLLQQAAALFGKENKEVWVYDAESEKNIIHGQYNNEFIWLSKQTLTYDFGKALATYVHELDHKYGTDQSAEFSSALTGSMATIMTAMGEKKKDFALLRREWAPEAKSENLFARLFGSMHVDR